MLLSQSDFYYIIVYDMAIHGLMYNNRAAKKLCDYLLDAKAYYDWAREGLMRWQSIRFSKLPWGTLAFLYTQALPVCVRK